MTRPLAALAAVVLALYAAVGQAQLATVPEMPLVAGDPERGRLVFAQCRTCHYTVPEQIHGKAPTPATDIYAFGATAFHLATGRPPFKKGNVIEAHLKTKPPHPLTIIPELSPRLADVILRCLEKKPVDRFASAADLREALKEV